MWNANGHVRTLLVGALAVACVAARAEAQLRLKTFASGFSAPVGMVQDPANLSVQFVVEQGGLVRVIQNGIVLTQPFLDVSGLIGCCGERGLLGLAFPPDTGTSRRFYVNYTNPDGHTVIARYKRSLANPFVADPSTRFDLKWASLGNLAFIPHPPYGNHNAGDLAFGVDGYLYIGTGDGGSGNDPHNNAQDPNTLLGKMLRIDVSVLDIDPNGYRVPPDNPFLDGNPISALPEIWDFGLRNPWRISFDVGTGGTGALIIADVGQGSREEVNYEPAGAGGRNYGWSVREGTVPNITSRLPAFTPLRDPIHDYDRSSGSVITGGYTYRGNALSPTYRGRYFFADFGSARLWSIGLNANPMTGEATRADLVEHTLELGGFTAVGNVSSFGRDSRGELYLVQYSGSIMKLVGPPTRYMFPGDFNGDANPDLLTQTQDGSAFMALSSGTAFDQIQTVFGGATAWQIVGAGHFNADSQPDLVWQSSSGAVILWLMNGSSMTQAQFIFSGQTTWRVVAVADINHSGSSDLIWQSTTGQVVVWYMQGAMSLGTQFISAVSSAWRIVSSSDFDLNGESDLVWQHPTGTVVVWLMQGPLLTATRTIFSGVSVWRLVSTGDVDDDGDPDLIWFGPDELIVTWLMQGTSLSQTRFVKPDGLSWSLSVQP
jgi:glucose/arabinose dehydrogenase